MLVTPTTSPLWSGYIVLPYCYGKSHLWLPVLVHNIYHTPIFWFFSPLPFHLLFFYIAYPLLDISLNWIIVKSSPSGQWPPSYYVAIACSRAKHAHWSFSKSHRHCTCRGHTRTDRWTKISRMCKAHSSSPQLPSWDCRLVANSPVDVITGLNFAARIASKMECAPLPASLAQHHDEGQQQPGDLWTTFWHLCIISVVLCSIVMLHIVSIGSYGKVIINYRVW